MHTEKKTEKLHIFDVGVAAVEQKREKMGEKN